MSTKNVIRQTLNLRRKYLGLTHRVNSLQTVGSEAVIEFDLYGSLYHKAKLEISFYDDCFNLCSLSVNGWLQSVSGFTTGEDFRIWFETTLKNYQIK